MIDLKHFVRERAGASAPRRGARPLPCRNSHNSMSSLTEAVNLLTGSHRRMAFCLVFEIIWMAARYGLDNLGFLTLTFGDHVIDMKEANRRFNSLVTNVLRSRYQACIVVTERMRSGRVHFHMVVALRQPIHPFNWELIVAGRGYRRAANAYLRSEWAFWLKACRSYGFGRHELLPIRGTAEGIAKYVGKYV